MDRRRFLVLMGEAAIATVYAACGGNNETTTPTPVKTIAPVVPPPPPISSPEVELEWDQLPALDRIHRIQYEQYPNVPDFDLHNELIRACAEFYQENSPTNKSADQLAENVFIVDRNEFIRQNQIESETLNQPTLSPEDAEEYIDTAAEFTTQDGKIFINITEIQEAMGEKLAENPEYSAQINNKNLEITFLTSVLFHAFSHANESKLNSTFEPITADFLNGTSTFKEAIGFTLVGTNPSGQRIYLNGSNEAATDFVGSIIGVETGEYLPTKPYQPGADLIKNLNALARISNEEFIDFYFSRKPVEELFNRWSELNISGQTDTNKGRQLLAIIGFIVEGLPYEIGVAEMQRILNDPNPTTIDFKKYSAPIPSPTTYLLQ